MAKDKKKSLGRIRNIGIMAHIDAGKTTLTERLLFITGRIHRMGEVHEGQAAMDWMPQEQERGITITSAVTTFEWENVEVHLIDTPGHVDFTMEVERSLRVLDGVITVLDAVAGVEPQTETVWTQADRFNVPRLVFVNKMDKMGASFERSVKSLEDHFGDRWGIVPLQIPIGEEGGHVGVVDLIEMKAMTWDGTDPALVEITDIPENLQEAAVSGRASMLEKLSDISDDIAMLFLEGEPVPNELILEVVREGTVGCKIVPVMLGSSLKNRGVLPILNAIPRFLPSPDDFGTYHGKNPKTGEMEERELAVEGPFCALVFKVMVMEDGRRMVFLRIYSGKLKAGSAVYNATREFDEKVSRIFIMHANQRKRLETIEAGNIVGVLGLKKSMTGDTLTDRSAPLLLETIEGMEPVISQAIEAMTTADKEKLDEALARLSDEDPTFQSYDDPGTGEQLVRGMGELHLEVIVDRLKRQFGLETRVGKPHVVFKETITTVSEEKAVFDREHEDKRMFGSARVKVEPLPRNSGLEFEDKCTLEGFPPEFRAAARDGALESVKTGPLEGNLMDDVRVTLLDVEYREGVSAPIAYRIAAGEATRLACEKAVPMKMEPIMSVEITVPEEYLGNAISSINERKGKVEKMTDSGSYRIVTAMVPLRVMFGYSKDIRTRTQGRGTFSMRFSHYDIMA